MQTHRDRGEPGGWGQQPAPSWTQGEGAGRGFALVLLPWVQPKELSPERLSHGWGGVQYRILLQSRLLAGKGGPAQWGRSFAGSPCPPSRCLPKGWGWVAELPPPRSG